MNSFVASERKNSYRNGGDNPDEEEEPELIQILRIIECPICREVPEPPIYNCVNGHFACNACRPKLRSQKCAYCFGNFTSMRNYPLETLINAEIFKCDYVKYGCQRKFLKLSEYDDHVQKCWARFMAPGRIKLFPKNASNSENTVNEMESSPCPKCHYSNPPRKLKCQDCSHGLRVPTPMYLSFDCENMFSSASKS